MLVHSEAYMNLILKMKRTKSVVSFTVYCSQKSWPDIVVSNVLLNLRKISKFSGILTPMCQKKKPCLRYYLNVVTWYWAFPIQLCVQLIGGSWNFFDVMILRNFMIFKKILAICVCIWVTKMKSTKSVLWCIVDFKTDLASFPSPHTI